jgi:type IV secretory pathway ATPase VirB11/archaellum biosynthesis ATPase
MPRAQLLKALFLSTIACAAVVAADPPRSFELADVHPSDPSSAWAVSAMRDPTLEARRGQVRGGQYQNHSVTLIDLISTARKIDPAKLIGGPAWLDTARFDVIAKVPPDATAASIPEMLQALLTDQRAILENAAHERRTILVSGGTSTGKTSMLNAIASVLPKEDRIVLIEDVAEICLDIPNVVQMQTRPARDGIRAVTIRDLVKQALRFRPDRLIVGEVRGAEAFDLLQALNSGHAGSMSTIHATTAQSALNKLALYAMQAALDIPLRALGPSIGAAVHIVVQMNRRNGQRIVDQILRVECYRRETDEYQFIDLTNED